MAAPKMERGQSLRRPLVLVNSYILATSAYEQSNQKRVVIFIGSLNHFVNFMA
jgi:hypothetical protein